MAATPPEAHGNPQVPGEKALRTDGRVMKEFLVQITTTVSEGTDPAKLDRRRAGEAVQARKPATAGDLFRLWSPAGELRSATVITVPVRHRRVAGRQQGRTTREGVGDASASPMDVVDGDRVGIPSERSRYHLEHLPEAASL